MLSYKIYYSPDKKLIVKYFPEENTINLQSKGVKPDKLELFKNSIETALPVDSSNKEGNGWTLKLKANSSQFVDELLKAKGLQGGQQVGDADTSQDNQQQMQQMPVAQPQQESLSIEDFFYESTYRSADYWDDLKKVLGKSKQAIGEKDILSVRRAYSRKPKSQGRNRILRALDRAKSYFFRKLKKEQGINAAIDFKMKYKSIGDLVSTDYSEDANNNNLETNLNNPAFNTDPEEQQPLNIANIFTQEDPYESDVDIEDEEKDEAEGADDDEEDSYEGFDILEILNIKR